MHNKRYIIAVVWSLLITVACLVSFSTYNEVGKLDILYFDKIVHFSFYTSFTMVWIWCLRLYEKPESYKRNASKIFLAAVLFGFIIELLQEYTTTTRSFEWLDVMANASGALFGIIVITIIYKNRNITSPH